MSAKANRLKSESNETPTASEKSAKKQRVERPVGKRKFGFLGNENFIRITGLFMLLFSLRTK
jgi:hypothetical protein